MKNMYYAWNCTKHGNYQFQEKYLPDCKECFLALKEELAECKRSSHETNSKRVNALYELKKAKELLGKNFADYILKDKEER